MSEFESKLRNYAENWPHVTMTIFPEDVVELLNEKNKQIEYLTNLIYSFNNYSNPLNIKYISSLQNENDN